MIPIGRFNAPGLNCQKYCFIFNTGNSLCSRCLSKSPSPWSEPLNIKPPLPPSSFFTMKPSSPPSTSLSLSGCLSTIATIFKTTSTTISSVFSKDFFVLLCRHLFLDCKLREYDQLRVMELQNTI